MARPERPSSRSTSSRSSSARGARPRSDGKVNISCPQCGAEYRIPEESLDQKIECAACHRVFFAKTTAGKRGKPKDNTKAYVGFGVVAVVLIAGFVLTSQKNEVPKKPPEPPPVRREVVTRGSHPRTAQVVKWAQSIGSNNQFVFETHSDLAAVAATLGVAATDKTAMLKALGEHESLKYFRDLDATSAELVDDESMTASTGKARVYVTPKADDDTYLKNTRGEIEVSFKMEGEQIKVTEWKVGMKPNRNPKKPDPSKAAYVPNKDIAKAQEVEITDSVGTRKVMESKPGPVPHWEKATPEQQAKADQIVADILRSSEDSAPGGLFNRAILQVRSIEDRKATVPRVLNAMNDCYADVMANNQKLKLLNDALVRFIGYSVPYPVENTEDSAKDKKERESCIRQWFAYWYRYSNGELKEFFEEKESLEMPTGDPKKPMDTKKK